MLTEMLGKGGHVCQPAKEGQLHCPLMVRPTSEDVITGHVCQVLRVLNARWWLPDVLNQALDASRFSRQYFRKLKIQLWQNHRAYPRELLPWKEGSTQVDATIRWENPPTTVFFEMKYASDLSAKVSNDDGQSGFPSDQLIRNARVGLFECGWMFQDSLFRPPRRDFVLIMLGGPSKHPLVERYRDPKNLLTAIPHAHQLTGLPRLPFIGQLGIDELAAVLRKQIKRFTRAERVLAEDLANYLEFKSHRLRAHARQYAAGVDENAPRQQVFPGRSSI